MCYNSNQSSILVRRGAFTKKAYNEQERKNIVLEKTKQMVHKHYCENDSEFVIAQFDDDIVWQGVGEYENAHGIVALTDIFRSFQGKIPACEIFQEEYVVQKIAPGAYLCTGKMWIATKPETGISLRVHQRITAVFRWSGETFKCCHLHISNPYDDMAEDDIGFPTKMANQSYQYLKEQVELQKKQLIAQTEMLKRLSYEDALTGIYNRNKFIETVKEAYSQRFTRIGIAYFDLNGLKMVNDLYGHSAGDELICRVAMHLWQVFPKRVYRTGGDEFVVVDTAMEEEAFRKAVHIAEEKMLAENISFSTGVSWRNINCDIEEQFEEADRLMYQEKRNFYSIQKDDIKSFKDA